MSYCLSLAMEPFLSTDSRVWLRYIQMFKYKQNIIKNPSFFLSHNNNYNKSSMYNNKLH